MTDTNPSKIAEFVQGMRWTSEHAYGDTLDEVEVLMALALADRIADLEAELAEAEGVLDAAATALNRVAWGEDFYCFVDAEWCAVNDALDQTRAFLTRHQKDSEG